MNVRVYAKLNLTLSVGDKQGKFHSVDSLVSSVDIFDEVTVVPRTDGKIYVRCDDARKRYYLRPRYIAHRLWRGLQSPEDLKRSIKAFGKLKGFLFRKT